MSYGLVTGLVMITACLVPPGGGHATEQERERIEPKALSVVGNDEGSGAFFGGTCDSGCPPGGTAEGEPDCHDDYLDITNSGCGGDPIVFTPITCNETVCGKSGTFLFGSSQYRDTDWYQIELPVATTLEWRVCADFPALIVIIDANQGGCYNPVFLDYDMPSAGTWGSCTASVSAGTYWLYVSPSVFEGVPCGSEYAATLYVDPNVCVCGDFDLDGDVDVDDFYYFLDAYGTCDGDAAYRAECDFDQDQCITLADYQRWVDCYRAGAPEVIR